MLLLREHNVEQMATATSGTKSKALWSQRQDWMMRGKSRLPINKLLNYATIALFSVAYDE
jgi:hypothetical protein